MMPNASLFNVLADTRSADQVIRLTAEALPDGAGGPVTTNHIYRHEWTHYFQYSALPTGFFLSQYRRNCFTRLKDLLRQPRNGKHFALDPFFEQLSSFNAIWEAWPPDWYSAYTRADTQVVEAHLTRAGILEVRLAKPDYVISLPLGLHAVYEAMAWCAAAITHQFQQDIPRTVDAFVYTWPLWVLADATGRDLDDVRDEERMALMPFLFLASCYDDRIMPNTARLPESFAAMSAELSRRDVTVGRLTWQLFRDYERFWSRPLNLANCDAYLRGIGLPALTRLFEETMHVGRLSLTEHKRFLDNLSETLPPDYAPLLPDVLTEVNLIENSLHNLGVVIADADRALTWPLLLEPELIPPVCALETPNGYQWFSIRHENDGPADVERLESRVILRQLAAIMEHVLMQLSFDTHVACYGPLDWHQPINACPAASRCMALPHKRGIEFCVDQAWRERIGEVVPAVFNYHGVEPPEELIPGIGSAVREYEAALRGEALPMDRVNINLRALGLGPYLAGMDQPRGYDGVDTP
ncbi:hypothetical protein AB0B20_25525 [Micromonospora sp. NPDC049151]|uniref:hypothetical protein n=1 Tax=Micromonospora sp. NPDC049151 TaxID=3155648 RepID=UPI0033C446D9